MDSATRRRRNALNLDFYRRHATAFDRTRRRPWPGWEPLAERLRSVTTPSILDLGCGNGRLGHFLRDRLGAIDYVGVDASPELLALAAERAPGRWRFVELDLVEESLEGTLGALFDLVTCFGVMHHLPGYAERRALLESMTLRVDREGFLAVSFWQFGDRERFRRRSLAGDAAAATGLALGPGDHLLPWGESGCGAAAERALRFCHHVDRREAERLVDGLRLSTVDSYAADGRSGDLNLYWLLGSSSTSRPESRS